MVRSYACIDTNPPLETALADSYLQFVRPSDPETIRSTIAPGMQVIGKEMGRSVKLFDLRRYKRQQCRSSSLSIDHQFPQFFASIFEPA